MEKEMATLSSTLAWKIPWMEEPRGLQSMGSLRVWQYWATSLSLFTFMHWRRKWQPTPVFLPGESQGRGAWWAAVYGVTQSRTWLKWLSSSSSSKEKKRDLCMAPKGNLWVFPNLVERNTPLCFICITVKTMPVTDKGQTGWYMFFYWRWNPGEQWFNGLCLCLKITFKTLLQTLWSLASPLVWYSTSESYSL